MRKIAMCSVALAAALALPAQAAKPDRPAKPAKPTTGKSHKCKPHGVSYRATGALVSHTLTQTGGAATPESGDDTYSGTVTVNVTNANHHATTGEQTYTLDNARVRFYDADHNDVADAPKAGDRVRVKGKITKLAKKCAATGFTPTLTVKRVQFKQAEAVTGA